MVSELSDSLKGKAIGSEAFHRLYKNLSETIEEKTESPESQEYELVPANWVLESGVYTYALTVEGVTSNNIIIVGLANSLSKSDFDNVFTANVNADIRRIIQSEDTLTFVAYGDVPEISLKFDISVL